jgi:hypothetical protein
MATLMITVICNMTPCNLLNSHKFLIRHIQPTKWTIFFLRYLCRNITLYIPICLDPQGTFIREPNLSDTIENQIS